MRIIVDGDACPTKTIIEAIGKSYNIDILMIFDTSHQYESDYATIIIVDKGADSVDQKILNIIVKGDIVVTQDYGLAALVLATGCKAISQNGLIYDENNIDTLLNQRYYSAKMRKSGLRTSNQKKRKESDNKNFESTLKYLITL